MSNTIYDVAIVGGGISGLMAAYELKHNNSELEIAILERGQQIDCRRCYASENKTKCANCPVCSITSGYAGAGAFSDGKYNLGTSYGGTLGDELGEELAIQYIDTANIILSGFLPDKSTVREYGTDDALKLKCLQNNLRLLDMNVKHFGTDNNFVMAVQPLCRYV